MASPEEDFPLEDSQQLPVTPRKRKRDDGEDGNGGNDGTEAIGEHDSDDGNEDTLFIPDENDMVPEIINDIPDDDSGLNDPVPGAEDEETDDGMEENEGVRAPYDINSEPFPNCAIYDDGIDQVKTDLTKIPEKVLDILQQHDYDNNQIKVQRDMAATLLIIPPAKKIRIALLGDAGAGKSSVLNSLSDIQDLAKSLSGGQSCTCVPTEYSGAFPRQSKNYAARILYSDLKSIRKLLVELLGDYNTYAFQREDDWDEETHTAFKRKMQNALKTFQVLFCDLEGFKGQKTARATLQKTYENRAHKQLIALMMESCEVKLKDKISTKDLGSSEYREATTRAKLREAVDPLITSKNISDQPALWPLVKQVCIGVRGSRVLKNVTIIDLPGISDTNETRVNLCKQYVKTCDCIWIVANISRVVDDGMVDHLLSKYGKIFKSKVAVICTHSDNGIESKLAREMENQDWDVSEYRRLGGNLKIKGSEVSQLDTKIKQMRNRKKCTKADLLDIHNKEAQLKKLKVEWSTINASRFGALVRVRNEFVTAQLQDEMEYHLAVGEKLDIFCVSNLHYAAAKGTASVRGAKLDADDTGIPALRKFALELPAQKLLRAIDDYSNNLMVVFLKNAALWVDQTTIERRKDLMELVRQPSNNLPTHITRHFDIFKDELEKVVAKPMRALQAVAVEAALKVHGSKNKKHPSTVRAFIKKNGLHSTKLCPKECWNEQFSKVTIDFVVANWETLEDYIAHFHDQVKNIVTDDLRAVIRNISLQPCAKALPLDTFTDLVDAQVRRIGNAFRDMHEAYEEGLRKIYLNVLQDSDRNYFTRSIKPVYDACNDDYGPGVTARSMAKIEAHLKKPFNRSPFSIMEKKATAAIVKNDLEHMDNLRQRIDAIFSDTFASFDRLIDRTAVDDPHEKPVRDHIQHELTALNENYAKVFETLEEIKRRYPE